MALYNRERARRAVFHTIGFRVLSQIATVVGYIVLVRGLSAYALGIYSLLYAVIPVAGTVASLGLEQTLKRFQPEFLRAGNLSGSAWLVRYVTVARLISTVALMVLLLAAWRVVAPLFGLQSHRSDFALLSLVVVLYFQVILLQGSLASHMLHRYSVGSAVVLSVSKLCAYALLFATAGRLTLQSAILADTAAYVLTWAFLYVAHWRLCSPDSESQTYRPDADERRRMQRYALISNFSDASSLLLYVQTDNLFIAAFMNPVAVGTYAFYARLNEMTLNLIPIRLFENVVNPLFFSVPPEQAAERLPRYFTLLVNVSLLVQLPLIAFSVAYHREIVQVLFGGKFIEYSALLPVVVAFALSDNVISMPVTMVAQYEEKASIILKSQLFGLYQIAAMLTLIPLAGLYGAAIATGTLHLFRNAYVWWRVRDLARWQNWAAGVTLGPLIWGVTAGLCLMLKQISGLGALANMACGLAICAIAALIHIRSAAISRQDRAILAEVLHGREAALLQWLGMRPPPARPPQ
jgi:O-antigen/teichoic acid export membrane protein